MTTTDFTVRVMSRRDLEETVDWAAAEGWNPGLDDAACFHEADPDGFLMGFLGDEPVAAISVVRYGSTFGFLGLYIVRPEHRGRGYGMRVWKAGLEYLEGRVVGLDGVVAQQDNYRKSGFTLAYRNVRYQGTGGGWPTDDPAVVELSTVPFDELAAYDGPFFPDERRRFLRRWVAQPHASALGLRQDRGFGPLSGYGVIRACRSGYKVGPLFADTPAGAETLFLALRAHAPADAPLFLDAPEVNRAALDLVRRHGMTVCFETARMYKGGTPDLPLSRIFGVTTFELG